VYRVGLSAPAAEADEAARRVAKLLDEGLSPGEVTVVGPLSLLKRTARRLERLGMATRLPLPRLSATPAGEAALRLVRLVAQDHPDALAAFLDQPAWEPEPGSAAALRRAMGRVALATARQTLERLAQGQRPHPQGEEEASTPASLPPSRQAGQLLAGLLAASLKRLAACPPDLASRAQALAEELGALVPMTGDTPQARLWRAVVQAVRRVGEAQVLNLGGGEWHDVGLLLEAELESSPAPPQLPQAVPVELLEPSDGAVAWARAVVVLGMAAEDLVFSSPHVWDPEEMASQAYRPAWGSALAMASGEEVYGLYTAVGRLGPRPPSPLLEGVPECAPLSTTLSEWEAVGRCLGGSQGLSPEARRRLAQGEGPLAAPARWRAAHEEPEPTPYDGHVGDLAGGEAALPRAPSATSLEEMGRCPYRYFLNRLVGLGEGDEEDPWANWDLERWEWGVVAHAVLWRVRQRARAQGVEPLRPGVEPWLAEAVREACQEALGPYGHRTLAPVALRALEEEVWNVLWADMAEGDGETVAAEWTFGPDEASRLDLRLPTFGTVSLRGRVDRIWRRGDGTWVVEDYKTGRDLPSTQVGPGNLQMAAYILAVRAAFGPERVVGRYRSVRGKGLFRSRWLEEVEEREVASLVEEAYARMAQGRFPPHPGRHCSSCPYQAVCPPEGEREERARRKGLVPGLTRARREEG
jgi:RecB family exonuclease